MPDITATRPSSGAPIETGWGDQVHDTLEGIQAGTAMVVVTANTFGSLAVVFPRAYTTPPVVVVAIAGPGALVNDRYYAIASNVTTLGFTAYTKSADNVSRTTPAQPVGWIAIGTPA